MKIWWAAALFLFGCSDDAPGSKVILQVEGRTVECSEGTGAGTAPAPDDTTISCEQTYSTCSDGNLYRVVCDSVRGSGTSTCDCYVNDEKVAKTVSARDECPVDDASVNAACQWE